MWVTTSAAVEVGYPQVVTEALRKASGLRSEAEQLGLAEYWRAHDPELIKRRMGLAKSEMPLAVDKGILERRLAIPSEDVVVPVDAKLVRMRQDAEQSKIQLANRRLTGVQDLAWALMNTPGFLFNH